jgi:hypothetical protein
VVLTYGKVDGMRRMKAWEDGFRKQVLGSVAVLRGLDARSVRHEKTEAEVNEQLQQVVPPDIAILVDWEGDLVRAYDLPDADVSITILDAKGRDVNGDSPRGTWQSLLPRPTIFVHQRLPTT